MFNFIQCRCELDYNPDVLYDASCLLKEIGLNRETMCFMEILAATNPVKENMYRASKKSFNEQYLLIYFCLCWSATFFVWPFINYEISFIARIIKIFGYNWIIFFACKKYEFSGKFNNEVAIKIKQNTMGSSWKASWWAIYARCFWSWWINSQQKNWKFH